MKIIVVIISLIALACAAPQPSKLHFRNSFKRSVQNKPSPRVYGGNLADPHSIPFQAFLEFFYKQMGRYCGGVLISQNYVLSTEWCAGDPDELSGQALEVLVTLGAQYIYYTEDTQINVYSTDIVTSWERDLALVKLPNPVTFTDAIQPATLPTRADVGKDYSGKIARVSGWGSDSDTIEKPFDVLRYFDVEIADCRGASVCIYGDMDGEYVGTCHSDDGGPVAVDGVVIGIITLESYCIPGYVQRNVRIDSYLDWIEENSDVVFE